MAFDDLMAKLTAEFADSSLDELLINDTRCLERRLANGVERSSSLFADPQEMTSFLQELAYRQGVRLDPLAPSAGGVLHDSGAIRSGPVRWHAVLPPIAKAGPLLSLRRHRAASLTLSDFEVSSPLRRKIEDKFRDGWSLVVGGATSSGKTSLLTALLRSYAMQDRVVIIESLSEIALLSPHWISLVARGPNLEGTGAVSVKQLIGECLRLRPDRIVIGEIRTDEGTALGPAIRSGHGGVYTTIHADGLEDATARLHQCHGQELVRNRWCYVQLVRGNPPRITEVHATA